jgi:DNA helicase-2/ATP-dependent DNA helicase PcrA
LRIINVPPRAIGKKTLEQLVGWANRLGVPIYTALERLREEEETPLHPRSKRILSEFATLLEELIDAGQRLDLLELFDLVLERTGYAEYIRDGTEQGEERWNNLMELRSVASQYADLASQVGLLTFLEEVALVSDVDNYDERANAPTFLTLHMAKGLEFPMVFIVGLEEGVLPHSRSFDDREAMEEERRLCYVGITRAKERLYLINTFRRTLQGLSRVNTPSRFLLDIPLHLVKGSTEYRPESWLPRAPAAVEVRQFNPGDKVRHPQFGEGVVVSSKLVGDDEEVVVAFVGMKPKRLLVSFAQMERLLPTRG